MSDGLTIDRRNPEEHTKGLEASFEALKNERTRLQMEVSRLRADLDFMRLENARLHALLDRA